MKFVKTEIFRRCNIVPAQRLAEVDERIFIFFTTFCIEPQHGLPHQSSTGVDYYFKENVGHCCFVYVTEQTKAIEEDLMILNVRQRRHTALSHANMRHKTFGYTILCK